MNNNAAHIENNEELVDLQKIKSVRLAELELLSASRIKKTVKKARYLLKYGMPLKKITRYAILFTLKAPLERAVLLFKGSKYKKYSEGFKDKNKCYIAVNIGNAGIGDAIVAVRALRDILENIEENNGGKKSGGLGAVGTGGDADVAVDIFFGSPASLKFIALPQKGVRRVLDLYDFKVLSGFYDAALRLNTFFIDEHINEKSRGKIAANFPALLNLIENIKNSRRPIEKYVRLRPFSEGVLSDVVVAAEQKRETYLNHAAGIDNKNGNALKIDIDEKAAVKFKLNGKKFITIHDGWDENTKIKRGRTSTKSYPPEKWVKLVEGLKLRLPDYNIVQIGGAGNGSDIEGVDYNLRGQTTLREAAGVLARSSLHIDTDSGLVHIAASLGIKCAVLFGPTNIDYCSYGQNLNIAPKKCGNCWWSTDDWMERCPMGLETPECMASIEPAEVTEKVRAFLKGGGR